MNTTIKEILEILNTNGYEAYIVGGYVRDYLLHYNTNDYDICTNAPMKILVKLFNGKVNEYGSLNIKKENINIDITTFRKEKKYQNRKPVAIYQTNSLKVDLLRRDFTINTICMDKEGNILDLLDGRKDLDKKVIRMVGDVDLKLKQDPLRILRAIRFATILNFTIDDELEEAIIKNKEFLSTLSPYRIKEELNKILISPYYKKGLTFLRKNNMCSFLGISYTNVVYTNAISGMWAQIKLKKELPFTKSEKENIVKLQEIIKQKIISKKVLYQYGLSLSLIAGEILGISSLHIHDLYKKMPIHSRKELQISYPEICAVLKVSPSNKVKKIEDELLYEVLYEHIQNTKNDLIEYLVHNKKRWFK